MPLRTNNFMLFGINSITALMILLLYSSSHWIHPELFADLNADKTFKTFYEKFLSIPYEPGYFVSLDNK